jgi:FMN reductase
MRRAPMSLTIVVGNPKADSRTLGVAQATASALGSRGVDVENTNVIDLAVVASELFDFNSQTITDLLATVAASDLLIVASPTFKATYTGLLKVFFDRYSTNALAGTVAVGLMTGAAPIHALAVDVHLRPLLGELGASLPTRNLYVIESQFADLDAALAPWADVAAPLLRRALTASAR